MKTLIPFVPHLAHQCLDELGVKDNHAWPDLDENLILGEKIKIAIQINGKTREIIEVKKDLEEKDAIKESKKVKKVNDKLTSSEIKKIIFVKNKVINYLIK